MRISTALETLSVAIGFVTAQGGGADVLEHLRQLEGIPRTAKDLVMQEADSLETLKPPLPNADVIQANATMNNALLLLSSLDAAQPCSKSPPKVTFMLSQCLTDDEIAASMTLFDAQIISSTVFYSHDQEIDTSYSWTTYWDSWGRCGASRDDPPDIGIARERTPDVSDIWVDVNTGVGSSSESFGKSPGYLVNFLVCPDMKCPTSPEYTVIPDVEMLANYIVNIASIMYCSAEAETIPVNFVGDGGTKQCACCVVGEQCVCPEPLIVSRSGECVCPLGTVLKNGECVSSCFRMSDEAQCTWSDQEKATLSLDEDCDVTIPIAQDNYVADKRINSNDATTEKPMLSLTATNQLDSTELAAKSTWIEYKSIDRVLENQIKISAFGVYDLSMSASDYRHDKTCYGCLAVIDSYPPTAKDKCSTDLTSPSPVDFSAETLASAIAAEAAFSAFYDDGNIKNNGDYDPKTGANERCDVKTHKLKDFFSDYSDLDSIDTACFDDNFVPTLVAALPDANELSLKGAGELSALSCMRCCEKSIILREYFYNYQCTTTSAEASKNIAVSDSCKYIYCLSMPASVLASAEILITENADEETNAVIEGLPSTDPERQQGDNIIHRISSCASFDLDNPACVFKSKLKDLFVRSVQWQQPGLSSIDASEHAFWRYSVGAPDNWMVWDDDDELVIDSDLVYIYVEAWTHCGLLASSKFDVYVHLTSHTSLNFCSSFAGMWSDLSSNPRIDDDSNAICAYENSDFALMAFSFDSTKYVVHEDDDSASGYFSNVECFVSVAKSGETETVTKLQFLSESADWNDDPIDITVEAAFELVHDPMTAIETDIKVRCEFTYTYFDDTPNEVVKCGTMLTIADCDKPEIELSDVCGEGVCQDPSGLPGLFESCSGTVYTTDGKATSVKTVSDTCCAECDAIKCTTLGESKEGIKRCELQIADLTLVAATREGDASTRSLVSVVLGVSALAALVALVALVGKRATSPVDKEDDIYYPLRD